MQNRRNYFRLSAITTMDPVIIAAFISAASKAVPSIFHRLADSRDRDPTIQDIVSKKYSDLKSLLTPPCVKLLKFAEDGTYHAVKEFRDHLYPNLSFRDRTQEEAFDHEFEYRLRYLVATGFFTVAPSEYYITQLGAAFLAEARKERDFKGILP